MESVVQVRSDLLATDLSDTESVMLDIDRGAYFGVESVARTIWDALAEPTTIRSVCERVDSSYEVGDADLEADTIAFVEQLVNTGLANVQV